MDEVKLLPWSVRSTETQVELWDGNNRIVTAECSALQRWPVADVFEIIAKAHNATRPPIGTDEVVGPSLGAIPGSHPTDQAASHLGAFPNANPFHSRWYRCAERGQTLYRLFGFTLCLCRCSWTKSGARVTLAWVGWE